MWKSMVESDRPQTMKCCDMAHAHCVLDNEDYRHTHSVYQYLLLLPGNGGYVTARVTLFVHCPSCYYRTSEIQTSMERL
jgi:hypothetical protein